MRPTCRAILLLLAIVAPVSTAHAFNPVAVTVADLDGDGIPDAAVLGDDQVYLIRSNGDGTVQPFSSPSVSTKSGAGFAIASGFLDNNNAADLVVTNDQPAGNVSVLLGNGDGTFKPARLNNVGANPEGLVIAQLNVDASQDIAAVDSGESADLNVSLLYGNNDGTFKPDQRTTADVLSVGATAADFDQDGKIDLAVSNQSDGFGVDVLRNDPGCSACTPPACDCTAGFDLKPIQGFGNAIAIQAGLLDADGKPDLAAVSDDGSTLGIFLNTTSGTTITFSIAAINVDLAADTPNEMILADVNKDGRPDIVAINGNNDGLYIFLNNGSGGFAADPKTVDVGGDLAAVASGDFNNDGNPDLVLADNSGERAIFLFGDGTGNFTNEQDIDLSVVPTATPGSTDTPVPTVVLATSTPTLTPTVTETFTPPPTLTPTPVPTPYGVCNTPVGGQPVALATGDFNHDGNTDIAVADQQRGLIDLLFSNISAGTTSCAVLDLSSGTAITGIANPVALAAEDLNGDGDLDLAVVGSDGLSVFFGDGKGGFSAGPQKLEAGTTPSAIAIADLNRDGVPDIMVANEGSDDVSIFIGDKTDPGSYQPACAVAVGRRATGIVTADLNRDGRADFAVFSDQTNDISVFLQIVPTGTPTPGNFCPSGTNGFRGLTPIGLSAIPRALVVNQFNQNDTTPDFGVALSSGTTTAGTGEVFLGQVAGGNLAYSAQPPFSVPTNSQPSAIGAGDINRDGRTDLVIADQKNNTVVVFLGQGDGSFLPLAPIAVDGKNPVALVVTDIDGDGRPDTVVANRDDGSVSILITSQAPATPTAVPTFTAQSTPTPSLTATATSTLTAPPTATPTMTWTFTQTRTPTQVFTTTPATPKAGTVSLNGSCAIDRQSHQVDWNGAAVLALALCGWLNRRWRRGGAQQ